MFKQRSNQDDNDYNEADDDYNETDDDYNEEDDVNYQQYFNNFAS